MHPHNMQQDELASKAELKGVTGLAGGDRFYDAKLKKYVDFVASNGGGGGSSSSIMLEGNLGSHDYRRYREAQPGLDLITPADDG